MTGIFFSQVAGMTRPVSRWHIPATVLAAYGAEDISEADAWSTESHLARCGRCRADLAALVASGGLNSDIVAARSEVMARVGELQREPVTDRASMAGSTGGGRLVPTQPLSGVARWARPVVLVLRGPWVTAAIVAVLVAAAAELVASHAAEGFGHLPVVGLLGPLVPLAGVALCYRATDRDWAEVVLATPSAGLRLVLWRVLAVLLIAIPITMIVAAFDHRAGPVTWLLPALALAAGSLALGTRIELGRATGIVAGTWTAVVVAPGFLMQRLPVEVFTGVAQGLWAAALVCCVVIMVARRAEFGRLPVWRPVTMGQQQ